jgi:hypothetical protein
MATLTPCAANVAAIERPIPPAPPVTTAVRGGAVPFVSYALISPMVSVLRSSHHVANDRYHSEHVDR